MKTLEDRVQEVLHTNVIKAASLAGGCVGDVRRLDLEDGRSVVAKIGTGQSPGLALEGFMLRYLAEHSALPVPEVLFADEHLLLMTFLSGGDALSTAAQVDAARHLAGLHNVTAKEFGFERDTLIGGLLQSNQKEKSWLTFFRDRRLLYMAHQAHRCGRLPDALLSRIERLCARLEQWIVEPPASSLLHGDMWTGNILVHGTAISGFVDPAFYYGDPEIEQAFSTLFGTFGESFFRRYEELRPIAPGFFEERRDLYNLYPLLVHVRLFGGSYVQSVDHTLRRFGC
ncbi:MAG: fructosamine kinase family protein [Rhodospirillaceae bacterium]